MQNDMNEVIRNVEKIGVIGSPSTTSELALDILARSVNKKLVGELAFFQYLQENDENYALGQITEVKLRNIWHEDPTIRSLIRQRGKVDAVSERQDTHQGEMQVSAVFKNTESTFKPSILGTVPATGTSIYLANDNLLEKLLSPYKSQVFYLGNVYGSTPKLPLWFKHFGRGEDGAGEAYHIGIFGKTGSGKSVLAREILLAYSRYKNMGLLVIDPQGEFSKNMRGDQSDDFHLPYKEILTKLGKPVEIYKIQDLILDRWDLFTQILSDSPFFEQLSIPDGKNRELAVGVVKDRLNQKKIKLSEIYSRESFDLIWEELKNEERQKIFYRSPGSRERFNSLLLNANQDHFYDTYWRPVTELFRVDRNKAYKIERILHRLFDLETQSRPIIIIDLSQSNIKKQSEISVSTIDDDITEIYWNETIEALVIKRILQGIRITSEKVYIAGSELNALILIDEAHRLAPKEDPSSEELKSIRNIFIDSVRTTRKYGIGWMFISQTLSSLHRDIIGQLRILFFGFGLGMGTEYKALSELVGGRSNALDLYRLFRDPHSSFDVSSREYSFMTIGPVSPLSFSGTPLFFNGFTNPEEFLLANNLINKE